MRLRRNECQGPSMTMATLRGGAVRFPDAGSGYDLRKRLHDLHHVFASVPVEASELQKLAYLFDDGAIGDRAGHGDAPAAPKIQKSFVSQDAQGTEHCVGVDAQHRGQVLGGWQSLSRRRFTRRDGMADFGGHLIVQRDAFGAVHLDMQYSAIHSSTIFGPPSSATGRRPSRVLVPEARHRQQRRYRRSAVMWSHVALLVGALIALLITTTSGGSGTSRPTSTPPVAVAERGPVLVRPVLCFALQHCPP